MLLPPNFILAGRGFAATTWDPSKKGTAVTLSNGNLTEASSGSAAVLSILGVSSGKWYWEFLLTSVPGSLIAVGIGDIAQNLNQSPSSDTHFWGYRNNGDVLIASGGGAFGASFANGDRVNVAYDAGGGKLWLGKNGTWQASGDPAAGTSPAVSGLSGTMYASVGTNVSGNGTANFGASAFAGTVPSGFTAGLGA